MKYAVRLSAATILTLAANANAQEPTVVSCNFERLPLMMLTFRGGMGADDNTLQIGNDAPLSLSVGSSLMTANSGSQELVFSLRMPSSVTIINQGSGGTGMTYYGECVSSLPIE